MNRMSRTILVGLKILLPMVTVGACVGVAYWLISTAPGTAQQEAKIEIPIVRAVDVKSEAVRFTIRSQGEVIPKVETTLVAQVAGRIVSVAEPFENTGFFSRDTVLVEINPRDHKLRVQRLEASRTAAQARLTEARLEHDRYVKLLERSIIGQGDFDRSKAAYDVAVAEAQKLEAELHEANYALDDTEVRAPFDGYVRQKLVDVGQYVTPGVPLAVCFATDAVEIHLPVTDEEFGYLNLTLGESLEEEAGPRVSLETDFAGRRRRWKGYIVRSEALVDSRSRMVHLVARVDDPYGVMKRGGAVPARPGEPLERSPEGVEQPLAVGMFVDAVIEVPPVAGAFALPEACVDNRGRLFVIDSDDRLADREVTVLRREGTQVIVSGQLTAGERVCVTRLAYMIPGTQVRVVGPDEIQSGQENKGSGRAPEPNVSFTASRSDSPPEE